MLVVYGRIDNKGQTASSRFIARSAQWCANSLRPRDRHISSGAVLVVCEDHAHDRQDYLMQKLRSMSAGKRQLGSLVS